jgi:uncharacterized protein YukE
LLAVSERDVIFRESSRLRGTFERSFWRSVTKHEARKIAAACEAFEDATKRYGKREGALGATAVRVAKYLANMAHACRGRVDPSFAEICRKVKRSRAAVARAIRNLVLHGFLERVRRVERTSRVGAGPQLRQTSNAYRVSLPAKAAGLIERFFPLPADELVRQQQRAIEQKAYDKAGIEILGASSGMSAALKRMEEALERKRLESLARVQ